MGTEIIIAGIVFCVLFSLWVILPTILKKRLAKKHDKNIEEFKHNHWK